MSTAAASMAGLARLYGVQRTYHDNLGRRRTASADALLGALRALGAPIDGPREAGDALRERRLTIARRGIEPVHVAWDGEMGGVEVRVPVGAGGWRMKGRGAHRGGECRLELEDGDVRAWPVTGKAQLAEEAVEGERFLAGHVLVPGRLPLGMHRLVVCVGGRELATQVVSAPRRAWGGPDSRWGRVGVSPPVRAARHHHRSPRLRYLGETPRRDPNASPARAGERRKAGVREWGVFLPLYALRSNQHGGVGDFGDLEALAAWVGSLGGSTVGTLPLLAAFLDPPVEVSPYAPVSRLFWNELYVDVTRAPELEQSATARELAASLAGSVDRAALAAEPLVDYVREMALKRPVLEELARTFFAEGSHHSPEFARFLDGYPQVYDYARFRAVRERLRTGWPEWPQRLRDGRLQEQDRDELAEQYHVYVQWLAHEQLDALSRHAGAARLYLDLPLGVHPHGYDVWRERELFATGASGGSPPDAFFTRGQNWGFPPLHPEAVREDGYRYLTATLRQHLRYAGMLRIDHVMSLHRLFWVPDGLDAREGVYVRYPAEELYAVLTLESHRHQATIVGEDLGTVTREVRQTMGRHGLNRMHVMQFEIAPDEERPIASPPRASVASLNTHDMPTFAGFWQGLDIQQRLELGLIDRSDAADEAMARAALCGAVVRFLRAEDRLPAVPAAPALADVLRACLAHLAAGPARVLLVNIEDLWLETGPQNVPGTGDQLPNWKRKARFGLEQIQQLDAVADVLRQIDTLRQTSKR